MFDILKQKVGKKETIRQGGAQRMTSLEIAQMTGMTHKDVLKTVHLLLEGRET